MLDDKYLNHIQHISFDKLKTHENDIGTLPDPYKTVVAIYSAQGVIDNGGLQYFFENDWPNHPSYSIFIDAYHRIGRSEASIALHDAVCSFGFANPELYSDKRRKFLSDHYNSTTDSIKGWNDCICGDEQVWSDLITWSRAFAEFQ